MGDAQRQERLEVRTSSFTGRVLSHCLELPLRDQSTPKKKSRLSLLTEWEEHKRSSN